MEREYYRIKALSDSENTFLVPCDEVAGEDEAKGLVTGKILSCEICMIDDDDEEGSCGIEEIDLARKYRQTMIKEQSYL